MAYSGWGSARGSLQDFAGQMILNRKKGVGMC